MPAFGALVAEPLFLLTDSAIVGALGTSALAGLAVASTVLGTLVGLFVVLAYGTTAAVARRLGAGDQRAALDAGVDGTWLAAAVGVVVAAAGVALTSPVVAAFDPGPAAAAAARDYLAVSLLGVPAMLVVLAATGAFRGLQDTRTPLVVAVVGFSANALLSLLLVHGPGPAPALGVAGSALGSVLAQSGMALWLVVVLARGARRAGASLRPSGRGVLTAARAGVPLLLRTVTLRLALVLTTWAAATTGEGPLAAHQVAFTVWTLAALALDAVAIAAQALTGRYLGAGDAAQVRLVTARLVRWGLGTGVALGALLVLTAPVLPLAFARDPEVRTALTVVLLVIALTAPLSGYVFVLDGVLIGAGDGRYLAGAGLVALVCYLPLALLVPLLGLSGTGGLTVLWLAFAGGFVGARAVTVGLRARGSAWLVLGAEGR